MRRLNWLLGLLLTLTCMSAIAAPIREWSDPYREWIMQIPKSPGDVLAALNQIPPAQLQDPNVIAQHHSAMSMVYFALSYPQKSLDNAQTALKYVDREEQPWLFHMTKLNESQAFDIVGTPNSGLLGANAAVIWGELNDDLDMVVNGLFVRGVLRNSLVDYQGALKDLQRAYELAPSAKSLSRGDIAGMLALVYEYRREDAMAIPFFEEAAEFHRENENDLELSIALYGLGKAHNNLGNTELGRSLLTQSKNLAQVAGDLQGVAYALKELAGISLTTNDLQSAEEQLQQALDIFLQSDNKFMLVEAYKNMLLVALAKNELTGAERYLNLADSVIDKQNMPIQSIELDETRALFWAKKGENQKAFELLYETVSEKQQLLSQQSTRQLHSLRSQYEIDMKERENQLLEQQNQLQKSDLNAVETKNLQLLLLFGATLIICGLLIIMVYRALKNRARFEKLANTDSLTGLSNRRSAMEKLHNQMELAQRHNLHLAIAIADIDLFKKINDTYGHAVGDKVLKRFGQLCTNTFRQTDVVGRIGGEEFLIALPHTSLHDAENTLKSLSLKVKTLSEQFSQEGLKLSISIGLTQFQQGLSAEKVLLHCDTALYQAKRGGRDKVVIYDKEDPAILQMEL